MLEEKRMNDDRDEALIRSVASKLYTAVLSDVLDELGYPDQAMPTSPNT